MLGLTREKEQGATMSGYYIPMALIKMFAVLTWKRNYYTANMELHPQILTLTQTHVYLRTLSNECFPTVIYMCLIVKAMPLNQIY